MFLPPTGGAAPGGGSVRNGEVDPEPPSQAVHSASTEEFIPELEI